ncbi:MAG: DJ-1 family glyoxalase III [Eubacteriales bacterium]
MKKVLVFLADGAEEIEAITPVDMLRRAGAEVVVAGIGKKDILCAHGVRINADTVLSDVMCSDDFDMVVLPGGGQGTENLFSCEKVRDITKKAYEDGKFVAAICAAPSVLGRMGLLEGKRATCYPGFEKYLAGAECVPVKVVRDGNIITSRGAGAAMSFALELVSTLYGDDAAENLRKAVIA